MADVTVRILDPADDSEGFLSLAEAKRLLGLPTGDAASDATLQMQILIATATIMRLCNRQFARERVTETWRDFAQPQVYLTRYPVDEADIEKVEAGGTLLTNGYELEAEPGKLRAASAFGSPLRITYTGGYELPDAAPWPLKQACFVLMRQSRSEATRESVEGIKSISHKDSRVMFLDPSTQIQKSAATPGALGSGSKTVDDLLMKYTRLWI